VTATLKTTVTAIFLNTYPNNFLLLTAQ